MAPAANEFTELTVIDGGNMSDAALKERASFKIVGSEAWATKLRSDTAKLAKQLDTGYMLIAEKLWTIYDTPIDGDRANGAIYTRWKDSSGKYYGSFEKYVEAELGIHYKKANRLIHIWKTFKINIQIDDVLLKRVVNLGLSKVRELARPGVITDRNVDAWVLKAETSSALAVRTSVTQYINDKATEESARNASREFEAEYNGSLASPTASPSASPTVNDELAAELDVKRIEALETQSKQFFCMLFGDQIETVNLAMRRSGELSGSDKIGHNLSLICLDFLATNDFRFESEEQKLRFLAKFEKLMGYKLVVIDPITRDVVFGIHTLEKIAGGDE
jgi:hypothetical protein